ATDIAARGIDINELRHVMNYDIPNEPESYVHRIGRCGRAGKKGISISISEPEENAYVRDIEKLIGKQITEIKNQPFPQTEKPMNAQEKKAFEKEKNRKKQEFFANRKKNKNSKSRRR
ncbi:MAG: ATP-dependent helicase, partial [Flavobacteriales bacterium]|nr:ATP-dependent helicase [Flavobacteriales bacterium]